MYPCSENRRAVRPQDAPPPREHTVCNAQHRYVTPHLICAPSMLRGECPLRRSPPLHERDFEHLPQGCRVEVHGREADFSRHGK